MNFSLLREGVCPSIFNSEDMDCNTNILVLPRRLLWAAFCIQIPPLLTCWDQNVSRRCQQSLSRVSHSPRAKCNWALKYSSFKTDRRGVVTHISFINERSMSSSWKYIYSLMKPSIESFFVSRRAFITDLQRLLLFVVERGSEHWAWFVLQSPWRFMHPKQFSAVFIQGKWKYLPSPPNFVKEEGAWIFLFLEAWFCCPSALCPFFVPGDPRLRLNKLQNISARFQ